MPVVLQVVPRLNSSGGTERGTIDIANALSDAGWGSVVVSEGGPLITQLKRAKVQHITMPVASKNPLVIAANVPRLVKIAREVQADIIHARSRAPAWSACFAAKKSGAHFVTTVQGIYGTKTKMKRFYNSIITKGEVVIANSQFTAQHIKSVYGTSPERISVIPRGVDLDIFSPGAVTGARIVNLAERWRIPDGVPVIMLPGRLTRWKGHEILIDAIAYLGKKDLCCIFVGEGSTNSSYSRDLQSYITHQGLGSVVRMVGPCSDMPAAYMLADVVVSASSRPEAFGRVLMEAEAMGRPVVGSNHGGTQETVLDGETGWLFDPGDYRALANSLNQALSISESARDLLSVRAIQHVSENFSLIKMCNSTLSVYEKVLEA